ncbi:tetratricopeptide repeat protein [Cerasicoccus maritimus]|uniref:tetratricopeptide repeat protein n=1 Tax=Cerasicoccus maritimus TaxID=490089 RepID=UPI002852C1C0|nr:hypothetical protein [Cerasicoccus maritimus]
MRILPTGLALFVAVSILGGGYWAWQAYEFHRAERLMVERQYAEVIQRANRLIAFGPDADRALKIKLQAQIHLSPENAHREVMALLAEKDVADYPEISLGMLQYLVKSEQFELAHGLALRMEQMKTSDPDFQLLMAQIAINRGDVATALNRLSMAVTIDPNHAKAHLLRARILLSADNQAAHIQAKASLRVVAELRDPLREDALIMLATQPGLPLFESDREWLIKQLSNPERSTPTMRFLADTQRIILQPLARYGIAQEAVKREGKGDAVLLVRWLIEVGAYENLWQYLASDSGKSIVNGGRWRVDILTMLGRDPSCAQYILESGDFQVDDLSRAILETYVTLPDAVRSGDESSEWRRAYELALQSQLPDELQALGELARQAQWRASAEEALLAAFETSTKDDDKIRLAPAVFTQLSENGSTRAMISLSERLLEIEPGSPIYLNNQVYLEALLGEVSDVEIEELQEVVAKGGPNGIHSALALCLLQRGRLAEAEAHYAQLDPKYFGHPSCRLVGLLLAVESGDEVAAKKMVLDLKGSDLLPEEQELYDSARSKVMKAQ